MGLYSMTACLLGAVWGLDHDGCVLLCLALLVAFVALVGSELLNAFYSAGYSQSQAGLLLLVGVHLGHVVLGLLMALLLP